MNGFALLLFAMAGISGQQVPAPASGGIVARHPASDPWQDPNPLAIDRRNPSPGIWRDLGDIDDRIDDARSSGSISRREARQYRREVRLIGNLAARYGHDGLSDFERRELDMRASSLRGLVNRPRTSNLKGN